jgi:hypothetical protein
MTHDDLVALIAKDPGNPQFVILAENFRARGQQLEAVRVLMAGLSANPTYHRGRLLLARLFYELQFVPFAIRELEELQRALPQSLSIAKLLNKFGVLAPRSQDLNVPESLDTIGGYESERKNAPPTSVEGEVSEKMALESTLAEVDLDFDDLEALVAEKERK